LLLALTGCSSSGVPPKAVAKTAGLERAAIRVAVKKVSREALATELNVTAEFRPYQEVEVMSKISGYLKTVEVDVGDRVRPGQLLAAVEIPEMENDLEKYKAAIQQKQAEIARARQDVKRAETAAEMVNLSYTRLAEVVKVKPGLVAQHEIDTAQNRALLAESQIASAKSSLSAAEHALKVEEAEAGRARTLYAYTRVTAPFGGVVTKRYVDPGAMIQAGTASHTQALPVVRISQTHILRLILPVPESVVPQVRLGSSVLVRVPTLGREFRGRVARSSGKVISATRTMETEIDVPNPEGILVPGMYAEAVLELDTSRRAIAVPVDSVDYEDGEASVLLVTKENLLERRKINLGVETPAWIEVLHGLNEGELVVVGSRGQLRVGQNVQPKLTPEVVASQKTAH
jgi:RND family efflux transporter MFP subunit